MTTEGLADDGTMTKDLVRLRLLGSIRQNLYGNSIVCGG